MARPILTNLRPGDWGRFWTKVAVGREGDCWEWLGGKVPKGYGVIGLIGRKGYSNVYATRMAWALDKGEDPGDLCVCHRCDNPGCVNPRHLFLGTVAENNADMASKGRQRTVPRYGEDNNNAKLTNAEAAEIRRLKGTITQAAVAARFGVSLSTVWNILSGRQYQPPA